MKAYINILIVAILPTLLSLFFIALEKTPFKNLGYKTKQAIYGISFGLLAVLGTEKGVLFSGATVNARDAAVIVGGLIFGSPTAIIAGLIGGIERYFAVYWGAGAYTRIACTVSTAIAGFYTAALRKHLFEDRHPSAILAFATGLVMEVFHMTMVFLTNMSDSAHAMEVVKQSSIVMIPVNALGCLLAVYAVSRKEEKKNKEEKKTIAQTVQRWLLICVFVAFSLTSLFMLSLQSNVARESATQFLSQAINDIEKAVSEISDENLLNLSLKIKNDYENKNLSIKELINKYDVAEINIVNEQGVIIKSNINEFIGFDFNSGEQSKEFMSLLEKQGSYVQDYGPISYDEGIYRKYAGYKLNNGFIQIGYDANEFQDEINNDIKVASANRHIGNTGYILIANEAGEVVSSPEDYQGKTLKDLGLEMINDNEVLDEVMIGEDNCFVIRSIAEGFSIFAIYPELEAYHTRNIALYANTFMEILVFALMFVLIYLLIKFVVVNKIKEINDSLTIITNGNLNEIVKVNSNKEFVSLSDYINNTVTTLKQYIKEANERIDAELEYAKNIQNSALPHVFPESDRYEVYALMDAAKEVGGDFYDFFRTSRNGVNFLIADVSGKGIPGAMFMMRAKSELHSLTETGIEVNDVFTYGNNSLCEGNDAGMFVTAWEGNLDLETGLVKFANAGHNPPVLIKHTGECEYIKGKPGFVLAGMDGINYKIQELQLEPGDVLFLYTDGVVEATNNNDELFGEERLLNCLRNMDHTVSMEYMCCEVIGEVGRFVGDHEQFDDITMLGLRYKGNNK